MLPAQNQLMDWIHFSFVTPGPVGFSPPSLFPALSVGLELVLRDRLGGREVVVLAGALDGLGAAFIIVLRSFVGAWGRLAMGLASQPTTGLHRPVSPCARAFGSAIYRQRTSL